ncbi:MAG: proteasome component M29 [Vezdaea aestivalis]|nr:MAG: proteasome component M29 [Vezdaea aestivalis]
MKSGIIKQQEAPVMASAASTRAPGPAEAAELELVSKVELRIAVANSDTALESTLKIYLTPLLLKLESNHLSVRNKVIFICQHISTRIQPPSIKLPVLALLTQFKSKKHPLIRQFDMNYLRQGFERLPLRERVELLPKILIGLSADSEASPEQGAILFNLFLKILPHYELPDRGTSEDVILRLGLGIPDEDLGFICEKASALMLLSNTPDKAHPGISDADFEFLTLQTKYGKGGRLTKDLNLVKTKVSLIRFIDSGLFLASESQFPNLYASADTSKDVSYAGTVASQHRYNDASVDNDEAVAKFFAAYFGGQSTQPVETNVRIRILEQFSSPEGARKAARSVNLVVKLINEAMRTIPTDSDSHSSLRGVQIVRFKSGVFRFVEQIIRVASPDDVKLIAPAVIDTFREIIEVQGWPNAYPENRSEDELKMRLSAYEIIGSLAKASPDKLLYEPNLEVARFLFRSLAEDVSGENIAVSVTSALAASLSPYALVESEEIQNSLRSLFLDQMQLKAGMESPSDSNAQIQRSTQFAAIRFSNRIFAFHDIQARWMDLRGLSSDLKETVDESERGLNFYWYQKPINDLLGSTATVENSQGHNAVEDQNSKVNVPRGRAKFPDFLQYCDIVLGSPGLNQQQNLSFRSNDGSFEVGSARAVSFGRIILLSSGRPSPTWDESYERTLKRQAKSNDEFRKSLIQSTRAFFQNRSSAASIICYVDGAFESLLKDVRSSNIVEDNELIEVCAIAGDGAVQHICGRLDELEEGILSNDKIRRQISARAFGILASSPECPTQVRQKMLDRFFQRTQTWNSAVGADINRVHGSILAISNFCGRHCVRTLSPAVILEDGIFVGKLIEILRLSTDTTLLNAVFGGLEQLAQFASFRVQSVSEENLSTLLQKCFDHALKGDETAIRAMSRVGMMFTEGPESNSGHLIQVVEQMIKLHEIKGIEGQIAVGEGFACLASGWDSRSLISTLDVEAPTPRTESRKVTLDTVLTKVLEGTAQPKPSLRKASIIWLLCLIQHCGHLQSVQQRLRSLQTTFIQLLADKDDLVAEAGARGLSIVYDKSPKTLRDELMKDFIGLYSGKKISPFKKDKPDSNHQAPSETSTADAASFSNLSQRIVSLATAMGSPNLAYQLMPLTTENEFWSSGAALANFGLNKIEIDSGMDEYLAENPKLYVQLHKYRFDPNPKIQRSMAVFWDILVKDHPKIVELHFDEILKDHVNTLYNLKENKTFETHSDRRENSHRLSLILAISDLIREKDFDKFDMYLDKILDATPYYTSGKGDYAVAIYQLHNTLSTLAIREIEHKSIAESVSQSCNKILDFWIDRISEPTMANQMVGPVALDIVFELIRKGGTRVKKDTPSLIKTLLSMLSLDEFLYDPKLLSRDYLSRGAAQYLKPERVQFVLSRSGIKLIEEVLERTTEENMAALINILCDEISKTQEWQCQLGCSQVIVLLATRHKALLRPGKYISNLVQRLTKHVALCPDEIADRYAIALSYLLGIEGVNQDIIDDLVVKLAVKATEIYLVTERADGARGGSDETEDYRLRAGKILMAISRNSQQIFRSHSNDFVPLTLVGKQDKSLDVAGLFKQIWSENSWGTLTLAQNQKSILDLIEPNIQSRKWSIKYSMAEALGELANACANESGPQKIRRTFSCLDQVMGIRKLPKRKGIFEGYVTMAISAFKVLDRNEDILTSIKARMFKEASSDKPTYRSAAVSELTKFLKVTDVDWALDVQAWATQELDNITDADTMQESELGEDLNALNLASIVLAVLATIKLLDSGSGKVAAKSIEIVAAVSVKSGEAVQTAVCDGLEPILSQLEQNKEWGSLVGKKFGRQILNGCLEILEGLVAGVELMRLKRANLLFSFAKTLHAANWDEGLGQLVLQVKSLRERWMREDRALPVVQALSREF